MGVGKTTLGRQIADELSLPFFDLDLEIEKIEEDTISSIFKAKGEEYFRIKEQTCLKKLIATQKQMCVIALGGGTMCYLNNHNLLLKSGIVIYLKSTWPAIEKRLHTLKDRPKLEEQNTSDIKRLYQQRAPIYALSQLQTLANTSFTAKKVVNWLKLLTNR